MRLKDIIPKIIGTSNSKYIEQIDRELSVGGPVSIETYIFKILDTNKINCEKLADNQNMSDPLIHLDKKYIDSNKTYCTKYIVDDFNRTLKLLIQNDILVLNIFMD